MVSVIVPGTTWGKDGYVTRGLYSKLDHWIVVMECSYKVTHWQPLPLPAKKDQKKKIKEE